MSVTEKTIPITRMDCPTCIPTLEKAVSKLEGVVDVKGNYIYKYLKVVYDSEKVTLDLIEKTIENVGYQIAYKDYPSVISRLINIFKDDEPYTSINKINDEDFPGKVLHSSKPVAVLFSSKTCPSCQVFKPSYEELAKEKSENVFYEMDISITETWKKFDVMSIPTVIIFKNGKIHGRFTAMLRTEDISSALLNSKGKNKRRKRI